MNTLKYHASLTFVSDTTNHSVTDVPIIELLCGVLGLPYPGEKGFGADGVANVGDVFAVFNKYQVHVVDAVEMAAYDANLRLLDYYMALVSKDSNMLYHALETLFHISPSLGLQYLYLYPTEVNMSFFGTILYSTTESDDDKLYVLSNVRFTNFEGNVGSINNVLIALQSNKHEPHTYNTVLFGAFIDFLLRHDCRKNIERSLATIPLCPFYDITNTLKYEFINVLERKGFLVLNNGVSKYKDRVLANYTSSDEGDVWLWNYLVNNIRLIPSQECVTTACYSGNLALVAQLKENYGLLPSYTDMLGVLVNHHYVVADNNYLVWLLSLIN